MEETIFVMQLFQRTNTLKKEKKMSVLKKNKKKNLVNPFGRKPKEITPNAIVLAYRSYSWQRSVL